MVRIIVLPALCFKSRSHVPLLAYGSIPDVGSSKKTISESPISAIAQLRIKQDRFFTDLKSILLKVE